MKTKYLILGATGGIGYGLVKALLNQKVDITILVRNHKTAFRLFGDDKHLTIVEGDATNNELLNRISKNVTHIFHGLNVSYEKWGAVMPLLTKKVIDAASTNKATLIFPGNIYNYGNTREPISEVTPFYATTELGKVRVSLELMLQEATNQKRIKTMVVRLPEIWGPNVTNKSFESVFTNAIKGSKIPWLYNVDIPQQLIYNLDAGRAITKLSLNNSAKQDYSVINVGGELYNSMRDFFKKVSNESNTSLKIQVVSQNFIKMLGLFNPTIKTIQSLKYKYEKTILLDDNKFKKIFPAFEYTPNKVALKETINWYKEHIVAPKKALKKQNLKRRVLDFIADNLSIGIFPFIIAGLIILFPKLQAINVLLGVVAGIYWSPLIRTLFRKLFSIKS